MSVKDSYTEIDSTGGVSMSIITTAEQARNANDVIAVKATGDCKSRSS